PLPDSLPILSQRTWQLPRPVSGARAKAAGPAPPAVTCADSEPDSRNVNRVTKAMLASPPDVRQRKSQLWITVRSRRARRRNGCFGRVQMVDPVGVRG